MDMNVTKQFPPEPFSKDVLTLSPISIFVLFFMSAVISRRIFSYSIRKIKTFDYKNAVQKSRFGLFIGSPQTIMEAVFDHIKRYPSLGAYILWLGPIRFVIVSKPEDLQIVLNSPHCLEKSHVYRFFINTVGEGLFSAPVEKWKKHRRIINPAFNIQLLSRFFPIFNEKNGHMMSKLAKEADTGKAFDLWTYISPNTLDTICQTMMGYDINSLESAKIEFEEALKTASAADALRCYKPWLYPDIIFKVYALFTGLNRTYKALHKLPEQIIRQKQKKVREKKLHAKKEEETSRHSTSFLDLLLEMNEAGAEFSNDNIRDEVVTMMVGGSETSAITLSWTLLMLAMNPEIQEKAYEEIASVLGDEKRPITVSDVNDMTFLDQCIRETMRIFPPGPIILRRASDNLTLSDNFVIPTDANIVIIPLKMQRHPEIYNNPLVWNPDNFSPEAVKKRHRYSFVTFSGGPRGCIGSKYAMLSMKVTLAMILRKYSLTTDIIKLDDIKLQLDLMMRSVNGYKVKIYLRNK